MESTWSDRDRTPCAIVGSFVEVHWSLGHPLGKRYDPSSVFIVRALECDMICLELVYDAQLHSQCHGQQYWVNVLSVQYLQSMSEKQVARRIEELGTEVAELTPRD